MLAASSEGTMIVRHPPGNANAFWSFVAATHLLNCMRAGINDLSSVSQRACAIPAPTQAGQIGPAASSWRATPWGGLRVVGGHSSLGSYSHDLLR